MSPSWTRSRWPFTPVVVRRSAFSTHLSPVDRPNLVPATNGPASPHPIRGASGCVDTSSGDNGEIILPAVKSLHPFPCTLHTSSSPFSILDSRSSRNSSPHAGKPFLMVSDKVPAILSSFDAPLMSSLGIRNFVVGITVKVASDEVTMRKEKTFINKLNLALVQVSVCSVEYVRRLYIPSSPDPEARVAT